MVALAVPFSLSELPAQAEDFGLAATSGLTPRIQSGALPGGGKFTLPPVGQQPFPVLTAPTGVAGGAPLSGPVDPTPAYTPQTSCDPSEKPGLTAFKALLLAQYPASSDWGSSRNCTDDGISEHLEGRALDWHADAANAATFAAAGNVLQWLTANDGYEAKRLGIMYIGYNHRIWGAYSASQGWRQLNNSNPHTDHVHFSFTWAGAMKKTSFWTGTAAKQDYGPCRVYEGQPAPLRTGVNLTRCPSAVALPAAWKGAKLLWRGSTGAQVQSVQSQLGVSESGFGAKTQKAVAEYQTQKGLPVTGAVDAQTYFALGLGTPGAGGGSGVATAGSKKTLKLGSQGKPVKKLQRALGMSKKNRTGYFGPKTVKKVTRYQSAHGLKITGKASPKLQIALGL